ncbi:hypothetical protein [Bacillus horti]|uniref:PepSY domain-containing protein n=1 Tax=Caldalkalibacillus horti TaxID=77523 RepID=A0ABT9W5V0_9BACI|nr:hypothetical protein [Bacillus horti]MDQ0168500.1 hypothetical protein [Bacillus horti]
MINVFQRNSHAQLYLKNISTGEEKNIPTDIQTKKMVGLRVKDVNHWVILEPSDGLHQYTLSTTKELGIPIEKFEINVNTGAVKRLE